MIEPTERTLWLLAAAGAVGALGFGVPVVGDAGAFLLLGLALLCALDFLVAGSPRRLQLQRILPELVVEGRTCELRLSLVAPRALSLDVVHSLPADALSPSEPTDVAFAVRSVPTTHSELVTTTAFTRRGRFALPRVAVRSKGPLGLMIRRARHDLGGELCVLPDVARIGARAERLLRGLDPEAGARRRARAEGRELDSLRDYLPGDDPRLVEWKVSARRGTLITKKMRPEVRQDVIIALDVGRQMSGVHDARDGGEPRVDVAVTTALMLAAAALSRGDRVGLAVFAGDVTTWLPPKDGRGQLRRMAQAVFDARAVPEEADYAALARLLTLRQKRRAMVVFVTDVLDEPSARALASSVARLRGRHVPLVLAVGDPALSRLAHGGGNDPALQHAASLLLKLRARALAALDAAGAVVVDAPAPRAAALAVQSYADLKAQGRL